MNKTIVLTILFALFLGISENRSDAWIFRTKSPTTGALENVSNDNYLKITQLEVQIFGLAFEGEEIYSRIARIENRLFNQVSTDSNLNTRISNILANSSNMAINGISQQDIAEVEFKLFKKTYVRDNINSRLQRLETKMFGTTQSGNHVKRFALLKNATDNYETTPQNTYTQTMYYPNTGYDNYHSPYNNGFPVNNSGGWRGVLRNFAGSMMMGNGTMTGFSPQVYDPYNTNNGFQYNSGGYGGQVITPYGTRNFFSNTSGGAGVRILP